MGDPVILFDERNGEPALIGDDTDETLEVRVLVDEAHATASASAAFTCRSVFFVP